MTESDPSGEQSTKMPDYENEEPDSFRLLTELIEKLGPEGANALHNIALAERDLRTASTVDPGLMHALERADDLMQVRFMLEHLLHQAEEVTQGKFTAGEILTHSLGEAAIRPVKRQ